MFDELLWCPSGYIQLCEVPEIAHRWAEDGLTDSALKDVFNGPAFMSDILGQPLARGNLRAVGVSMLSGKLLTILPSTWRRLHRNDPYKTNFSHPIQAALAGYEIWVGDEPLQELCRVVVALADLARALDAKVIQSDPRERPADWFEQVPSSVKLDPARSRHAGGAPPKHKWEDFWIEVANYTAINGLDSDKRIELQKHMEAWTADAWPEPPEASTIRKRLASLHQRTHLQ